MARATTAFDYPYNKGRINNELNDVESEIEKEIYSRNRRRLKLLIHPNMRHTKHYNDIEQKRNAIKNDPPCARVRK